MDLYRFPIDNTASDISSNKNNGDSSVRVIASSQPGNGRTGLQDASPRRPVKVEISDIVFSESAPEKREKPADPIKSLDDIQMISQYLIDSQRYRDNLLFVAGINLGLRCGDLLQLKVGHLLTEDGSAYRDKLVVKEQKTKKIREAYWNDAIYDAADLYFQHEESVKMDDYLFRSNCNRVKADQKPITVRSTERLLKEIINEKCGLQMHIGTHTLRKTFSYHILMSAPDRSRAIEFLQKILGHSSPSITLAYAGITNDEIEQSYKELNLGRAIPFQWSLRGRVSA